MARHLQTMRSEAIKEEDGLRELLCCKRIRWIEGRFYRYGEQNVEERRAGGTWYNKELCVICETALTKRSLVLELAFQS